MAIGQVTCQDPIAFCNSLEECMTVLLMTENINDHSFFMKLDTSTREPFIEYKGKSYQALTELVQDADILSDVNHLQALAKIANFLFRGAEFEVIDDIAYFKNGYAAVVKAAPQYGEYDVSVIHSPAVKDGKLSFFVEHSTMHVPYRVTCTYPYHGKDACYSYSLLKPNDSASTAYKYRKDIESI